METLIQQLISEGYLKTPEIIKAFREIDRKDFVPSYLKDEAYINAPLSIGFGQTISQPLTVAFMLELLQPKKGDKILDIGSGSGWTTALLAYIVGQKDRFDAQSQRPGNRGRVFAIEIIPELKEFGENNVRKYNFIEKGIVKFFCGNGYEGLPEYAPFDKILCSASALRVPKSWKVQLKTKGRIVAPIGESIWLIVKNTNNKYYEKEYPGFAFVPLINH